MSGPPMISRTFTPADQAAFAQLSRDFNPVHLDATAARRTLFGRPIVHGLHIALWMLDRYLATSGETRARRDIAVRFNRPLFLDEAVVLNIQETATGVELKGTLGGALLTQVRLSGPACDVDRSWNPVEASWHPAPAEPAVETLAGQRGRLQLPYGEAPLAGQFPRATAIYGAAAVAHLLALTRIVGMEVPGLNSLFGGFAVRLEGGAGADLDFSVSRFNAKTSHVQIRVQGEVLTGGVDAFLRPVVAGTDPGVVTREVRAGEFAGRRSLVIGGSRGLGLVTALQLAAGGAHVVTTYRVGREEAEAGVRAIRRGGGRAEAIAFDAADPAAGIGALKALGFAPTDVYYFATPHIFERKTALFEPEIFTRFVKCYVTDFANIVDACLAISAGDLSVFFPSSEALDAPVKELIEYSAAKSAGEVYCDLMSRFSPRLRILRERLPRLPTDQTATLMKIDAADPATVMLDLCRRMGPIPADGSR